jgi:hypothetical protein
MQAGLETLGDLFYANRRSRRVGGPQLASTEREQIKAALKSKGRIALGDVEKEMGNAYRRALNVKLIDIFAGAWSGVTAVAELGDTTKYPPGEKHFVPLANHRITSDHRPKVEVLVDGMPLVSLTLDVNLRAQFEAAVLEVEGGHIHAVKPGNCLATASVSCRGVPIASTSSRRLALPAEMELQPPFAIRAFGGQASPLRASCSPCRGGREGPGGRVSGRAGVRRRGEHVGDRPQGGPGRHSAGASAGVERACPHPLLAGERARDLRPRLIERDSSRRQADQPRLRILGGRPQCVLRRFRDGGRWRLIGRGH